MNLYHHDRGRPNPSAWNDAGDPLDGGPDYHGAFGCLLMLGSTALVAWGIWLAVTR